MNQGRPLLPSDLATEGGALWLLELEWEGVTYRWATALPQGEALVITDEDGVDHVYQGGIGDISWVDSFALLSESAAPPSVQLSIPFGEVEAIAERIEEGFDLQTMTLSLYRWAPTMTYEERRGVFYGVADVPNYGGTAEDVQTTFVAPLYRDGIQWPEGRLETGQIAVDADLATGEPYPVIFGAPAASVKSADYLQGGSPALPFDASNKYLLAGIRIGDAGATATLWPDGSATSETSSLGTQTDERGRLIHVVTSTDAGFDAGSRYWIEWSGDPIGAGDLMIELARQSTLRVDYGRMYAARDVLNAYKLDGYYDTEVSPWEWGIRNVLPFLPASVAYGLDGVYLRAWDDAVDSTMVMTALDADASGIVRVGPVQYERTKIINEVVIRYAPSADGKFTKAVTVTGRRDLVGTSNMEVIVNPYAVASVSRLSALDKAGPRQGVRKKTITAPIIYETATALRVAMWMIRMHSVSRRVVIYEDAQWSHEWLDPGQIVQVTDSEIALSSRLATVRAKRWNGPRFYLELALIDDITRR